MIQLKVEYIVTSKQDQSYILVVKSSIHLLNFNIFLVYSVSCSQKIKSVITLWPQSNQTQPSSVFSWLFWPCQVLLQSGSLSSRVEVDMIAFKQPLLASDTQLQPGTSSDSKSTMMDCLAKTADQRRSKFRSVSDCTRHVQSPEIAFPVQTFKSKTEFSFADGLFLELQCNYVINYWEFSDTKKNLCVKNIWVHRSGGFNWARKS